MTSTTVAPTRAEITQFIEHAVRAPSVLNTQPWRFVVGPGEVALRADRSRQLAALDPTGRELTISCGAALHYLTAAAQHYGWASTVREFPDPADPDLLAIISFEPGYLPPGDDRHFRALALRRTNRLPFRPEKVPFGVASEMAGAAAAEGAALHAVRRTTDKGTLADLVAEGVHSLSEDRAVTDEIRSWLRPPGDHRPDGVSDEVQGTWDRHAALRAPTESVAAYKARLVREAPVLFVLTTPGDGPADWLDAGRALARSLVVAADRGLAASYANEPVEAEGLRREVAAVVGGGTPQIVFRVGYPDEEPTTPRRRPRDVIEVADDVSTQPLS